jgi:hypothetical protein
VLPSSAGRQRRRQPRGEARKLWTKPPTIPTNFLRRMSYGGNSGAASHFQRDIVFHFKRGLIVLPSSSLSIWVPTTAVAAGDANFLDPVVEFSGRTRQAGLGNAARQLRLAMAPAPGG